MSLHIYIRANAICVYANKGEQYHVNIVKCLKVYINESSSTDVHYDWARHEKNCLRRFENNKGADQHANPRSLISAFVIRLLESSAFVIRLLESSIV